MLSLSVSSSPRRTMNNNYSLVCSSLKVRTLQCFEMSVTIYAVSQLHTPKNVDLNKSGLVTICKYRNVLQASDNGVL